MDNLSISNAMKIKLCDELPVYNELYYELKSQGKNPYIIKLVFDFPRKEGVFVENS